jgi:hypothetical protein
VDLTISGREPHDRGALFPVGEAVDERRAVRREAEVAPPIGVAFAALERHQLQPGGDAPELDDPVAARRGEYPPIGREVEANDVRRMTDEGCLPLQRGQIPELDQSFPRAARQVPTVARDGQEGDPGSDGVLRLLDMGDLVRAEVERWAGRFGYLEIWQQIVAKVDAPDSPPGRGNP